MTTRRPIGSSEIEVAPLAFGGNVFGWTADRDASFEVLDAFVAGGGNLVDTADGYSHWVPGLVGGESETIIGEWLASRGTRDRVVIATKVFTHPQFAGLAPANVQAAAEASLGRMGIDCIDLYYAHFDDPDTPMEQSVIAFSELVDQGKIRAIGLSNFTAERVNEWVRIATAGGYHAPVALQPHYSLVERGFETNGLRDVAQAANLGVFTYYSLAKGFLTGKYRDEGDVDAPGGSPRAKGALAYLDDRGRRVIAALDAVAAARGVEHATVALAWLKQQSTVTAPIASARNTAQLPALLGSLELELSDTEVAQLTEASA